MSFWFIQWTSVFSPIFLKVRVGARVGGRKYAITDSIYIIQYAIIYTQLAWDIEQICKQGCKLIGKNL